MSKNATLKCILLVLLLTACDGNNRESVSPSAESASDCLEDDCTPSKDAYEVSNGTMMATVVSPCLEDREHYVQSPSGLPGTLAYMLIQDTDTVHFIGKNPFIYSC